MTTASAARRTVTPITLSTSFQRAIVSASQTPNVSGSVSMVTMLRSVGSPRYRESLRSSLLRVKTRGKLKIQIGDVFREVAIEILHDSSFHPVVDVSPEAHSLHLGGYHHIRRP